MEKSKIAFLVSGEGGSLKVVVEAIERLRLPWQICLVLADRECGALEFARRRQLPAALVAYARHAPGALRQALTASQPDVIVTTIHKILDAETLARWSGQFINLHYSLLPAFAGLIGMETVAQAQRLNAGLVGATCHEVIEAVDSGPILAQCALAADWRTEGLAQVANWVFRGAGLALLEGLRQKIGPHAPAPRAATITYQQKTLLCAPPFGLDPTPFLKEAFWQAVQNA